MIADDGLVNSAECHVRLTFDQQFVLDYRADRFAAELCAKEIGAWLGAVVTIDDAVHAGLPPLPCARLWSSP